MRRHQLDTHQTGFGEDVAETPFAISDPAIAQTYRRHRFAITRRRDRVGQLQEVFNFPILDDEVSLDSIMDFIREIFLEQDHPFRINFAFGFLLDHIERQNAADVGGDDEEDESIQPRYFHAFRNNHVLQRPFHISSQRDITRLRKELDKLDVIETTRQNRPNSKWLLVMVTNIRFVVTKLPHSLSGV